MNNTPVTIDRWAIVENSSHPRVYYVMRSFTTKSEALYEMHSHYTKAELAETSTIVAPLNMNGKIIRSA